MRLPACLLLCSLLPAADLYRGFQDPPRTYSVRPFWFWNGRLDPAEIRRQVREMAAQGVYGAYLHNRNGLETPYLSEEYFAAVAAGLDEARKVGFLFGIIDEYEWPGGDVRDVWLKGSVPSRVVVSDPAFRMRSLQATERRVTGPAEVRLKNLGDFQFASAARLLPSGELDPATLTSLTSRHSAGTLVWQAPAGEWLVLAYSLVPAQGADGGLADLLNPAAVKRFIDLVHEEYYRRFPSFFGSTIDSFYSDHEGDYGFKLAWTPAFFERFQALKGYDLRPLFPLLSFDGGRQTPKVRCDYLDVLSELYAQSYFAQVGAWCERRGIKISGHLWEESLGMEAAYNGDLARTLRAWPWPGVDSLWERGRRPRDLKLAASIAHFRGTRFTVENQGLQGADSFFDLQKARLGTNMILNWGANLLIPHAFNYHRGRIEYPPDWFDHQPWWRYFRHYADYSRRASYMNDQGRHVAPVLIWHPLETAWALSAPVFDPKRPGYLPTYPTAKFGNRLDQLDIDYTRVMDALVDTHWDFDSADAQAFQDARVTGATLNIGPEEFQAIVLPASTTIRRATLARIRDFFDAGGIVAAFGALPTDSMEEGRDDPQVAATVRHIFHSGSPRALFEPADPQAIPRFLAARLPANLRVAGGGKDLYYSQRRAEGAEIFWLVNDSERTRRERIDFRAAGTPERWDPATGVRAPLCASRTGEQASIELDFDPWDAYFVVFTPGAPPAGKCVNAPRVEALAPLEITGAWTFTPETVEYGQPYGERIEGGSATNVWLSRERHTVRDWYLAGPFSNADYVGFDTVYPPEREFKKEDWTRHTAPGYAVDLPKALGFQPRNWLTCYARTWIWSPRAQRAYFRIAANNNAKLWVNGENLVALNVAPYYFEMREDFALTRQAPLRKGWNEILVKINRGPRGAQFGFLLRVTDQAGENLPGIIVNADHEMRERAVSSERLTYRVAVPFAATAVRLPPGARARAGDTALRAAGGGWAALPAGAKQLTIETASGEDLPDVVRFRLSSAPLEPGNWTAAGLPYYSGSATYSRSVELPAGYAGKRLFLDLGRVGSAAELKVNGKPAGERVWLPYRFDVTSLLRPGSNTLEVRVTNTMANERAVENHAAKLPKIDPNGLHGPVRLYAYE